VGAASLCREELLGAAERRNGHAFEEGWQTHGLEKDLGLVLRPWFAFGLEL